MAWWNDFVTWMNSTAGTHLILNVILPFLAIVVAGIVAALIGRAATKRVLAHSTRELQGAAIIALITVGRKAAIWSSLGSDERRHVDSLMTEADIRVRLIPITGAGVAADWAAHQLADMKKNSASFSFQADQTFVDYRDRLLDWQLKPGRARKQFTSDLQQWHYEDEHPVVTTGQEWTPAPVEPPTRDWSPAAVEPTTSVEPAASVEPATVIEPSAETPAAAETDDTAIIPASALATAPPPTVAPMDAPAPAGLTTSSFAPASREPVADEPAEHESSLHGSESEVHKPVVVEPVVDEHAPALIEPDIEEPNIDEPNIDEPNDPERDIDEPTATVSSVPVASSPVSSANESTDNEHADPYKY
jgi:hypothetical protein